MQKLQGWDVGNSHASVCHLIVDLREVGTRYSDKFMLIPVVIESSCLLHSLLQT